MTSIIRTIFVATDKETKAQVVAFDHPMQHGTVIWRHISSLYNSPIGQLHQSLVGLYPPHLEWMEEGSMKRMLLSVSLVEAEEQEENDNDNTLAQSSTS